MIIFFRTADDSASKVLTACNQSCDIKAKYQCEAVALVRYFQSVNHPGPNKESCFCCCRMPKRGIPQNTAKYWHAFCWSLKKHKQNIHIYDFHDVFSFFMLFFIWYPYILIYDFRRCFRQNQHVSFFELFFTRGIFLTVVNIKLWVWKETLFPGNVIVTRSLTGVRWTCEYGVNFILRSPLQSQFFNSYRFCGLVSAVNYIRTQKKLFSNRAV